MTHLKVSKIIHSARELCWHKSKDYADNHPEIDVDIDKYWCPHCKEVSYESFINPDYTDPTSYLEAMAWAMEQGLWDDFVYKYLTQHLGHDTHSIKVLFDPVTGSHALASYLEEKRD